MLKRAFDIFVCCTILPPVIFVGGVIAILIMLTDGRPVFFRQTRTGLNGMTFKLYKFRTMKVQSSDKIDPSQDQARLTAVGGLLRKLSLDELPQVYNVLIGDMSLVGPRPLLPEYVPLYSKHQARRHEVRPGITGLAQVSGRNLLTWEERFDLDVEYVDSRTFLLDLKIIILTFTNVLFSTGVSAKESYSMEKFTGTPDSNRS